MAGELSTRQVKILKAVVEEYIETAEPVASEVIEKKHTIGVSPATIRSDMVKLTESGYLRQPYTSAGRVPTTVGLKFYIDQLMEEKRLAVTDEVSAKESVWDCRSNQDKLLHEAVRFLANKTHTLALSTTDSGDVYHSGYANILEMPEFYDIDVAQHVFALLDQNQKIHELFFGRPWGDQTINVILGEELDLPYFQPVGMVFAPFHLGSKTNCTLGVIGSVRLNYAQIIPIIKYMSHLLEDISQSW